MARAQQPDSIHQLKVTLRDVKPPIWRRIQVASDTHLSHLHRILQIVMGWENYHLYQFSVGRTSYGEPDPEYGLELRSARTGSMRAARQAGRKHAASAATVITNTAERNARGSRGLTR